VPRSRIYSVPLDLDKVEALSKVWDTEDTISLLQKVFDMVYRSCVEDEDGLMSVKAHRKQMGELREKIERMTRTIEEDKRKLLEKKRLDLEVRLCPNCLKRDIYDAIREEFGCSNCGWRGETNQTIIEE